VLARQLLLERAHLAVDETLERVAGLQLRSPTPPTWPLESAGRIERDDLTDLPTTSGRQVLHDAGDAAPDHGARLLLLRPAGSLRSIASSLPYTPAHAWVEPARSWRRRPPACKKRTPSPNCGPLWRSSSPVEASGRWPTRPARCSRSSRSLRTHRGYPPAPSYVFAETCWARAFRGLRPRAAHPPLPGGIRPCEGP